MFCETVNLCFFRKQDGFNGFYLLFETKFIKFKLRVVFSVYCLEGVANGAKIWKLSEVHES